MHYKLLLPVQVLIPNRDLFIRQLSRIRLRSCIRLRSRIRSYQFLLYMCIPDRYIFVHTSSYLFLSSFLGDHLLKRPFSTPLV
nr:hypothetical protein Q903MT_gene175 [Picea sitchensis]